jgi:hypothetical protein
VNWEALSAIGQLVGALGVIVTLIYLAKQIRQNTRATYANAYQTYTSSISQTNLSIASNRELACLMQRATADPYEDFDPVDRMQWSHFILSHLRSLEGLYVQRVLGPEAVRAWEAQCAMINGFAAWPAVRGFWFTEAVTWGWDEGFKAFVDGAMTAAERKGAPGRPWGAVE